MKATASEKSMATEAPTGIGRMYGPMSPDTKAMGRMAAITVKVARIVGFPTSSTASTAASSRMPLLQAQVPGDVLDHHDGVVHQDPDGEDQGEEGDPVQRVAVEPVDQEGQGQRHRHRHQDHDGLPPPQGEPDQDHHAERRHQDVEEQLSGLLGGGLAVVPGHRHPHVVPEHLPPEFLDPVNAPACAMVAAFFPSRLARAMVTAGSKSSPRPPPGRKATYWSGWAGPSSMVATSRSRMARSSTTATTTSPTSSTSRSRCPTRTGTLRFPATSSPAGKLGVGRPEGLKHGAAGKPAGRQGLGIERHGNLPRSAADHPRLRHVGNPLQLRRELHRLLPKEVPVSRVAPTGQGEREDRDLVDAVEGDEGGRGSRPASGPCSPCSFPYRRVSASSGSVPTLKRAVTMAPSVWATE